MTLIRTQTLPCRAVQELNRELGTKITIGGCMLWNADSFVDYVVAHK